MCAKQIDNTKVVMGRLIRVVNQNKKASENERYVSVQIEDESGENERCILFTETQINNMEQIQFQLALKEMKSGRLYNAVIDGKETYLVKVIDNDDKEMIYRLSRTQLSEAEERSIRNPEDLTKKSWLTNLKD